MFGAQTALASVTAVNQWLRQQEYLSWDGLISKLDLLGEQVNQVIYPQLVRDWHQALNLDFHNEASYIVGKEIVSIHDQPVHNVLDLMQRFNMATPEEFAGLMTLLDYSQQLQGINSDENHWRLNTQHLREHQLVKLSLQQMPELGNLYEAGINQLSEVIDPVHDYRHIIEILDQWVHRWDYLTAELMQRGLIPEQGFNIPVFTTQAIFHDVYTASMPTDGSVASMLAFLRDGRGSVSIWQQLLHQHAPSLIGTSFAAQVDHGIAKHSVINWDNQHSMFPMLLGGPETAEAKTLAGLDTMGNYLQRRMLLVIQEIWQEVINNAENLSNGVISPAEFDNCARKLKMQICAALVYIRGYVLRVTPGVVGFSSLALEFEAMHAACVFVAERMLNQINGLQLNFQGAKRVANVVEKLG